MSSAKGFLAGLVIGGAVVGGVWAFTVRSKLPPVLRGAFRDQQIRGMALGLATGLARKRLGL